VIPAVVLAAGRSSRLGRPKALLRARADTFLATILGALEAGGVSDAVVVAREGDAPLDAEVARFGPFARVVVNPRADEGQLSSLIAGINAVDHPAVRGALVALVDAPLVSPATIRALLDRAASSRAAVIRVTHQGRHGHPVVFMRAAFDAVRHANPDVGAKDALHRLADRTEDVAVDDPGVLEDVDTADDYRRLFGREPSS
jgi:molybdenum cofactor cytidylyltransferase